MWKTSFNSARMHKRRLIGTVLAVVMGVAFLTSTLVLGATTRAGVADLFADGNAGTDVVVRSTQRFQMESGTQEGVLDAGLVDAVRAVPGVVHAEPSVTGVGQIVGRDGQPVGGDGPPTNAANWIADPALNPYHVVEGREPAGEGQVVIDKASARKGHLAVGDTTTVLAPDPVPVTVVGIVKYGTEDSLGAISYVAFSTPQAQQLLAGGPDGITGIVVAGDGRPDDELAADIRAVLPAGVEDLTGAQLTAEQRADVERDFLSFMERFLLVFAGIALLAASFGIYNTFSILVAQKSRENALLRAVGASRGQVLGATVLEALLVGLAASITGVVAGLGLAAGLRALLDASDFKLPSGDIGLINGRVIFAALTGVVVTVAASISPALKASRVPPVAALRDVAVDRSAGSRRRALIGVALALGGIALTVWATNGSGSVAAAGLGAITTLAGLVALGPVVARPAAAVIGAPLTLRGLSGRLARRNAMRSPRRTAGAASSLLVGVGVVTLFTGFAASMKASMSDAVERSFRGDLVVEAQGFSGANLSPTLVDSIGRLPEVATAAGLAEGVAVIDGTERDVLAVDPDEFQAVLDLHVRAGSFTDDAATLGISHKLAEEQHWSVGDVVNVGFVDGSVQNLPIGAVYDDRAVAGDILVPRSTWTQHVAQRSDIVVLVDVRDGASVPQTQATIESLARQYGAPTVRDRDAFLAAQADQINQMLGLVYGLLVMAIIIAVISIANTVSLSIHERTRELGLLRAVGQQRRQVRTMVRREAMIVAVFGTVGGIGIGTFLSWALVRVVAAQEGLGTFRVPAGQFGVILGFGALAGILAAARPARRAARLPVLTAIAT